MSEYYFEIHQKVTVWNNTTYTVKANDQDEADAIITKSFHENEDLYDEDEDAIIVKGETDAILDTEDEMTPLENGNASTRELRRITRALDGYPTNELIAENSDNKLYEKDSQHDEFTLSNWKHDIIFNHTILGYHDWVCNKIHSQLVTT